MSENESTRFRGVIDSYYRAWFRYHPEAAVDAGVAGYEHLLTPFLPEPRAALVCLNDQLIISLDEIDRAALDADAALDYDIARAAAFLENQRILDVEREHPDPESLLPLSAIYQLTVRAVPDVVAALRARLEAIPEHLQVARAYLESSAAKVPVLWATSAVSAARQGVSLLQALPTHPDVQARGGKAFNTALDGAVRALRVYADFLERDLIPHAKGKLACGTAYFEHLLRDRHFLDVSASDLYAFGQRLVEQTHQELTDACRALSGDNNLVAVMRQMNVNPPPASQLLATYQQAMQAARQFVAERDLVTLPAHEQLKVIETPAFLRHQIPFAAYSKPSPTDPNQLGHYYVTPPADAEQLAEHGELGIWHTCVHEAWPGHHLQFVTANSHAPSRTLPRLLNPSATLYEGWALYCEQLMHEQGLLSRPEQRVLLLRDRLWRALRIVIDVGLHTRGMTVTQAADLFVTNLGFPRSHALADITWYTRSPTVPLSYATGWALINVLRDECRAKLANDFSLKAFHDQLLSAGSVALPLVIRRAFGGAMWDDVRQRLLN